jgi:hypothetical protein
MSGSSYFSRYGYRVHHQDRFINHLFYKERIVREERTDIPYPSNSSSSLIEDEPPPAFVVIADIRPDLMHLTTGLPAERLVMQKWTGTGKFIAIIRVRNRSQLPKSTIAGVSSIA